ncbi:predicted protein [Plenodomus lingam JN3]|uniref:Predicted protein n=1 Tax=Leptosphaeria maculans (strain JN3 / isolate v23.1.3 / race Av1-4-5-6-7-8) TaxID=985895 RepID=E4ZJ08_LEPMJ|nr:predicted protein [Plenodomus lingam JN3]CBX91439.1 predicted protein [Plenodomus lingam JN3]
MRFKHARFLRFGDWQRKKEGGKSVVDCTMCTYTGLVPTGRTAISENGLLLEVLEKTL